MIIDSLDNIEFYKLFNNDFYEGLKFIKNAPPEIALGSYPLTSTAKALVMEYETKQGENGFGYEAHKHLIDIQYCISGTELIPWCYLDKLKSYTEYDPEKDVTFYSMQKEMGRVIIGNGVFAVFYPADAHAPVFCTNQPEKIKKIVIKVSV